jgi:hypothetical protein
VDDFQFARYTRLKSSILASPRFLPLQTWFCAAWTSRFEHATAAVAIPRSGPLRDALITGLESDKDFGAS